MGFPDDLRLFLVLNQIQTLGDKGSTQFYNDRKTQNSLTVGVAVLILGLVLVKVFCINWYLQTKEQCQKRKFYWK